MTSDPYEARPASVYREFSPPSDLRGLVACTWGAPSGNRCRNTANDHSRRLRGPHRGRRETTARGRPCHASPARSAPAAQRRGGHSLSSRCRAGGALEGWVRARVAGDGTRDASIVLAARALFDDRHRTIDGLADQLGWSARRLHRRFFEACGYGPKMLQRILRLQRTIRLARVSVRPTMSLAGRDRQLIEPRSTWRNV
jgi:AraC-like DNA-binding protein